MSAFEANRRQLLHLLLTSPVLAGLGIPLAASGPDVDEVITTARQALNAMDFEAAARNALPPARFGCLATGMDDEATLRANREGFSHFSLRVRRLVTISRFSRRRRRRTWRRWVPPGVLPCGISSMPPTSAA